MTQARLMFSGRDFGIIFTRTNGLPPHAVPLSETQVSYELSSKRGDATALFQLHDIYSAFSPSATPDNYDKMSERICGEISSGWLVAYQTAIVPAAILTFSKLWESYPRGQPYPDPNGILGGNQCAVKMSVGLAGAGVLISGFSGETVIVPEPQGPIRAAIGASALARWLETAKIPGLSKPTDITGTDWRNKINGRPGIVYFSGYWPRNASEDANPKRYSGDHIDLWNGSRLEISTDDALAQVARNLGVNEFTHIPIFGQLGWGWHNLNDSKQILFWSINQ